MKLFNELLSVIVPVYNVEEYLDKCIESLIHQSYDQLEIILVDDGSTDHCGAICNRYQLFDPRIKVIHKKNGGLVSARKAGMKVARGAYVSFVDSDDWLELTMYDDLMGMMLEERLDMISSGAIREYTNGAYIFHEKTEPGIYEGDTLRHKVLNHFISTDSFFEMNISMNITNKIFLTSLMRNCIGEMPNDLSVGEDSACLCPFLFQAEKIAITEKAYYHYRIRESSIMGRAGTEDKEKIKRLYSYLINRPLELNPEMKEQYELQLKFLAMFFILLSDIPDFSLDEKKKILWIFPDVPVGSRVILCGAGRFGTKLYEYLVQNKIYEVMLRVDQNSKEGIAAYEDIPSSVCDYIIISAVKADVIRNIRKRLLDIGINMDCVREVSADTIRNVDIASVL